MFTLHKNFVLEASRLIGTLLLCLGLSISASAYESPIPIPKIDQQLVLDGIPNDALWNSAHSLPLLMSQPIYGNEPSAKTSLKIIHNKDALYIAGHFTYNESKPSHSRQLSRDDLDYSSDLFGLVIDGYNNGENAHVFITSPSGNKTDLAITNDGAAPKNLNWDTFWSVNVHQTDRYWSFEMRIPISSLQYQVIDNKAVIGISAWQYRAANNEFDTYPLISNEYGRDGYFKPSQTTPFTFQPKSGARSLYVSPYTLSGYKHRTLNSGVENEKTTLDIGLDAKYKFSSNFTLDATVNTDFAQVENDNQQINLSRFPLYQEEKRAFFQERSGLFAFNTGGPTALFYSRRIGLTNDGRQVPLYGGARLTGRTGDWDIGLISMQSAPKYDLSSENFSVLRLRKSINNSNASYLGLMSTSRISGSGNYNIAYGADFVWETGRDVFITGRYAHTLEAPETINYNPDWVNSTNVLFSVERRSYVGFFYDFSINRVGKNYNPGLGFLDRANFTRFGDRIAYGWEAPSHSVFQKYQLIVDSHAYIGNTSNELESSSVSIKNYTSFKSGFTIQIGTKSQTEWLRDGYALSSTVDIPAGRYRFAEAFLNLSTSEGNNLRLESSISVGSFFDGRGIAMGISPEWTISSGLEVSGDLEFYNIKFTDRNQHYRSTLLRGRIDFKPASNIAIAGLTQYNNLTNILSAFARLRFTVTDGSDLFLVYKLGQNHSPFDQISQNTITNLHSLQAKFSYTFRY